MAPYACLAQHVLTSLAVAKTRLMNMKKLPDGTVPYRNSLHCMALTAKVEGPLALYKGFVPTFTRQLPYVIVTWVTVEQIKKVFKRMNANK